MLVASIPSSCVISISPDASLINVFVISGGNISPMASPIAPATAPSAAPLIDLPAAVESLSPLSVLLASFKKKPIAAPLTIPPLAKASTEVIAPMINAALAGFSFANPP